ncbi:tetrapyrrole methylase family protein [gut metagenome]|uniref:Tetrapyrrole methylase family protein n=1 Tax=gut metagenome TaxID=749906 RepID=J9G8T5_9ZZZZ
MEKKQRGEILEELKRETRTIVLYEAPHRLIKTLEELLETLEERKISVCRELTKKHETVFRGTLSQAIQWYREHPPKGECVLVLSGRSREELQQEEREKWEEMPLEQHMDHYVQQGMDRKEAMKQVAKDRGVSKREIYQSLLKK